MFYLIISLWLIRTARAVLFWVWLWQLKEYRFDRFHVFFSARSGKKVLFNKLLFLKIILLFCFLFSSAVLPFVFNLVDTFSFLNFLTAAAFLPFLLLILYFLESAKSFKDFYQKKIKKPVFTKKAILILGFNSLIFISIPIFLWAKIQSGQIIYDIPPLIRFCSWLLLIDILTPIIISLIILSFQPLTFFLKKQIIQKAKNKIAKYPNLIVVGITGSYGKTSAKEFLATILSQKFNTLRTIKANTDIGVAKVILNELKPEHQIFIVEMGAYKRGEIKAICDIVKPKIGILTGINEQHLALFGSLENTVKAKFELIESLSMDGLAVLNENLKKLECSSSLSSVIASETEQSGVKRGNPELFHCHCEKPAGDEAIPVFLSNNEIAASLPEVAPRNDDKKERDCFVVPLRNNKLKIKFFSTNKKSDIFASDIKIEKDKIRFKVISGEASENFEINLIGKQNVSNILACVTVAEHLEMSLKEISEAVKKIKPIAKTMSAFEGFLPTTDLQKGKSEKIYLIDDTYNANPAGVLAALEYLKNFGDNAGRKIILFPGIIELGSATQKVHQSLGKKMAEVCDLIIITKKDFAEYITPSFSPPNLGEVRGGISSPCKEGVREGTKFVLQENPEKVYQILKNYLKPGDVVLFESRGMESVLEKLKNNL